MAPLPKRRHSSKRSGSRRSADTLLHVQLSPCKQCSQPKRSHSICPHCGYYRGKHIITIKDKKAKN